MTFATKFTAVGLTAGAALIAVTALVTSVSAQEVITDPGKCAQFYPNANCSDLGPGNPYTGKYVAGSYQLNHPGYRDGYAYMAPHHRHHHRHYHHG